MIQRFRLAYQMLGKITIKEVVAFLLIVLVSGSYIPIPVLLGQLLKQLLQEDVVVYETFRAALLLLLLFSFQALGAYLSRKILIRYIKKQIQNIRLRLLQKYLHGREVVKNETTATLQKKIFTDTELIDQFYNSMLTKTFPALVVAGVSVGLMLYLHVQLALFVMLLSAMALGIGRYFKSRRDETLRLYHAALEQFNRKVMFILRFRQLISFQATAEKESRSLRENLTQVKDQGVEMVMGFSRASNIEEFCQSVVIVVTLLASFWLKQSGSMQPETILMFFFVVYVLRRHINVVSVERQTISEGLFAVESVNTLDKNLDGLTAKTPGTLVKVATAGVVEFDRVTFHYPHAPPLFVDASFSLLYQKINLIQGANGVGKSTLMQLVLGQLSPVRGTIRIDGVDIQVADVNDLRSKVSVVEQESDLFDGTLRDNLLYGILAADREIEEVLEATELQRWISELPLQLDTPVSELAGSISGGQKQRLMVARALLKKPGLFIMDEPTNHLDTEFMPSFLRIIEKVKASATVLLISHDRTLENIADQKIRIYEGKVESILLAK